MKMGIKQQEKTVQTKQEMKKAAKELFLQKGYDATSIQDIADKAAYSVGSYYRQWKSKQQIFMEIWDEFVSGFIRTSVMEAPEHMDPEIMITYLLDRSKQFQEDPMSVKLSLTSHVLSATYEYDQMSTWFQKYKNMLYLFLKEASHSENEQKLMSTANIIHCILNADAMKNTPIIVPRYEFDYATLYECIWALVENCKQDPAVQEKRQ